jgi:hypothetical protein
VRTDGQLVCGRVDTAAILERCVAALRALASQPDPAGFMLHKCTGSQFVSHQAHIGNYAGAFGFAADAARR